jgi:acylphosphatase
MYRDFATRKARNLGIVGEVENKADGTVALVGEGEEEQLLALIEKLKKGPLLARVERVDVDWKEPTGEFRYFHIRY